MLCYRGLFAVRRTFACSVRISSHSSQQFFFRCQYFFALNNDTINIFVSNVNVTINLRVLQDVFEIFFDGCFRGGSDTHINQSVLMIKYLLRSLCVLSFFLFFVVFFAFHKQHLVCQVSTSAGSENRNYRLI